MVMFQTDLKKVAIARAWAHLAVFMSLALAVAVVGLATGCAEKSRPHKTAEALPRPLAAASVTPGPSSSYQKPPEAVLRKRLTVLQYEVTQEDATELPFDNPYWNHHEPGLYVDIVSGEPLFSSQDKFDSGTGWPSFTRPVRPGQVQTRVDRSGGMTRTEVRSQLADSHLGHVFDDGPGPSGVRYCINSASLRFIPVDRLEPEGYGAYRQAFDGERSKTAGKNSRRTEGQACQSDQGKGCQSSYQLAYLAGGCFWGMEELLRKIPGVVSTEVGYSGGNMTNPSYDDVKQGTTGHAETVKVVFDPEKLAYADLLENWFFRMHDPTTRNRQGNDVGTQYRSAIFTTSAEQRRVALASIEKVKASGQWSAAIVTEVVKAGAFTRAEEYHQRYLEKKPDGYTCHYMRDPVKP